MVNLYFRMGRFNISYNSSATSAGCTGISGLRRGRSGPSLILSTENEGKNLGPTTSFARSPAASTTSGSRLGMHTTVSCKVVLHTFKVSLMINMLCFKIEKVIKLCSLCQEVVYGAETTPATLRQGARGQNIPLPERGMLAHLPQRRGPRAPPDGRVRTRVRVRDLRRQIPQSREPSHARQEAGSRRRQGIGVQTSHDT